MSRAIIAFVTLLGSVACDEMPRSPKAPPASASANAPQQPNRERLLRTGRTYVEAARAHAMTCICYSNPFEFIIRDYCDASGPELEAVAKAALAVAELDAADLDLEPEGRAFLREAVLHARWLADYADKVARWSKSPGTAHSPTSPDAVQHPEAIRGGVPAFQTLARRFNEWQPKAKIWPIAYEEYRPGGVREGDFTLEKALFNAWGVSKAEFEKKKRETEYLPWIECFDGPCLTGY